MAVFANNLAAFRNFSKGKVVLTLGNPLLPVDKLNNSPSLQDGLDPETELDLRIHGCELIQTSGILLKLSQIAMGTGQVLFQRFYYSKSFVKCPVELTAMACITLASKLVQGSVEIRNVINVFNHMKQIKNGWVFDPVILDERYNALKEKVIKTELRLLKELGYCCDVKLPHKIAIAYLRVLEAENNKRLTQSTWNFMNDSLRTDVYVRYSPETIACSCIWLAGRQLKIPLPENPPWYHVFKVTLSDIEKIAAAILKLYARKKTKLEELEAKVEVIRQKQQEERLREKAARALATFKEDAGSLLTSKEAPGALLNSEEVAGVLATSKEVTTFCPVSRSSTPSKNDAVSPRKRKHSHSERRKKSGSSSGSSRRVSRSPSRHPRKKGKRSHTSSRSISRSRSRSRERYSKKKYSRAQSPADIPPRFIKNGDRPLVRSSSRSRLRSRSPRPTYDRYEKRSSRHNGHYDRHYKYAKEDRHNSHYERSEKVDRHHKYADDHRRYCHKDRHSTKYSEILDKSRRDGRYLKERRSRRI